MTPEAAIKQAAEDGVKLFLTSNMALKVAGKHSAVERWRPVILENKIEIVALLKQAAILTRPMDVGEVGPTSRWWRFRYVDRPDKEVSYSPAATHGEALTGEPDAIGMESFEPIRRPPKTLLSKKDKVEILRWLGQIGETDEETILDVINSCRTDANARDYFVDLAKRNIAVLGI